MDSKQESIQLVIKRLKRIINKHLRLDEVPISPGDGRRLTPGEINTLQAAGENQGMNIKTLGEMMGVTKSAASQMVGKLVKKGYLRKDHGPDNNKELLVYLTDSGKSAFQAHERFHLQHLSNLIKKLDEFTEPQIALAASVLAVVESVADERIKDLFG